MTVKLHYITILIACIVGGIVGCQAPQPPAAEYTGIADQSIDQTVDPAESFDITSYLKANRLGTWIYWANDLPAPVNEDAIIYSRRIKSHRHSEGVLLDSPFQSLEHYLLPVSNRSSPPASLDQPPEPFSGKLAAFMELDEPIEVIPEDLSRESPAVKVTRLRYYNDKGRAQAQGTLTRTVEIKGLEDIECPAGQFKRCLHVRVDLTIRFSWILTIHWTTHLWLSPKAGEVQRVQRFSGAWFLIFWFQSAQEYKLVKFKKAELDKISASENLAPKWKRAALLFDRGLPKPRISGMIVDYSTTRPSE